MKYRPTRYQAILSGMSLPDIAGRLLAYEAVILTASRTTGTKLCW